MSDEVKELWRDIKRSVMDEEKRPGGASAEELKKRFEGLGKEDGTTRDYEEENAVQATADNAKKQVTPMHFTTAGNTTNTTTNTEHGRDIVMHDRDTAMHIDSTTRQEGLITPITPGRDGRRPSWGYVRPRESLGRRASEGGTSSTPKRPAMPERRSSAVKSGNMYEVERDPRKRGR